MMAQGETRLSLWSDQQEPRGQPLPVLPGPLEDGARREPLQVATVTRQTLHQPCFLPVPALQRPHCSPALQAPPDSQGQPSGDPDPLAHRPCLLRIQGWRAQSDGLRRPHVRSAAGPPPHCRPAHFPELVSEKVGGAEGTKLDEDFKEMEKKVDVTSKAVTEVLARTIEYLQPNPASRAKLTMLNTVSKIRGQVKSPGYPQSEGLLGECMLRHGKELGGESNFGDALLDAGESMKRLAEVKDSLDIEVKQNFIDPLQNLCDKDLKEIQHHLKKLEGRRLDFDYKKKRQGRIPDEELRQALEKFEESKEVAETSMHNLLETDIEQVSQLSALVDAQLDYHRQAVQILDELADKLKRRMRDASSRPKREYKPKPREPFDLGEPEQSNGGFPCATAPKITPSSSFRSSDKPIRTPSRSMPPLDQPSCKALYDFEPENAGELGFHEGDVITLTNQIDENWYEGMLHGQSGFFPLSYVEVLVPLPQ
ncbi:endophilin-A2 isoform X1 [Enhydra lutris kenyoni]|uniref:Endophilin-A2 n=1 Tax=Enhydra lutris kenyoni TaxID=391180 RepID=A0A2Y9L4L2_ENHLU|nr:endophilin-A2 isoform X1 [Enhydra lutris kenyoni]